MKKHLLLTLFIIGGLQMNAQVGIGTTTPAGALDVNSTTDGLLIPRVALAATNTATVLTPTVSELVYNTFTSAAGANQVVPGFYYWNGSLWVEVSAGNNWNTSGNASTVAGTNFIGTTDAIDLRIKTGGTNRWNISNANSGQLQSYSLGTAALPVYSFQADQNTGLFSPAADIFALSTAGTERLRTLANGHVLINTTTNDATNGSDNVFEALAVTAGDDAISGYANGAGGVGVFGSSTLTGAGISGTNSGTGIGVAGTSVGTGRGVSGSNASDGYGVYGITTGNAIEDIAGVAGLTYYGGAATGYSSPLASAASSAIAGVCGVVASQETNANDNDYYFGVVGEVLVANPATNVIPRRAGGVLGSSGSGTWGLLGYRSALGIQVSVYGGISLGSLVGGAGKSAATQPNNNVGLGINGGFMGGYVKGNQFGLVSKGGDFGMYVDGNTITNKPIVQLIEDSNSSSRIATYAPASTSVDITSRGKGRLINGEAFVSFEKGFSGLVSPKEEDINITITPMGETKGVYISSITSTGFYVKENMSGTSNASFNWTAIGTREGFEKGVEISNVILSKDFDKNMDGVMHNDGDTETKGTPIYFDGTNIKFEEMPQQYEKKSPALKADNTTSAKNI